MDNLAALRNLCNAIANTFYPDNATVELVLFNDGIDPKATAKPKDEQIFRLAVCLVMGYVENSRSENGISTSVKENEVKKSIKHWCNIYGLEAEEVFPDMFKVIEDGTHLW